MHRWPTALWMLPLAALALRAPVSGESLVENGDFGDVALERMPHGWTVPEATRPHAEVADDEGHNGRKSLRFSLEQPVELEPVSQPLTCEPNTEYVLSAWFKSEGLRLRARVIGRDPNGREIVLAGTEADANALWHSKSARFNSGFLAEVDLLLDLAEPQTGTAWLDDVQVIAAAEYDGAAGQAAGGFAGPPPGPNVARGATYTLSPAPNYGYCTETGDRVQLTDGGYSVGYFWTQSTTVGWQSASFADVNIDLGEPRPIAGCSYSTAAGVAGVGWPAMIVLLVSEDGETWHRVGELVQLSAKHGLPPAEGYATHRFVTGELKCYARYFRLLIASAGPYTFCDEVEVYAGDFTPTEAVQGELIANPEELIPSERVVAGIRRRLLTDIQDLRRDAQAPGIPADAAAQALAAADELTDAAYAPMDAPDADWRAVHPLSDAHAEIHKARAALARATGAPLFAVWHKPRWDPVDPMELPPDDAPPVLKVDCLSGEYRAEALMLTNMADIAIEARLSLYGLPGGTHPDYLAVHQVEWIETQRGIPVADALPLSGETAEGWFISVPAGMTRQVWLTFHPTDLPPGDYDGRIRIKAQDDVDVPLRLRVHDLTLPEKLSCSLGLWDYTGPSPAYDITLENQDRAVEMMQSHFVDTPWGQGSVAPWPKGFTEDNSLSEPLDFRNFDDWVSRWPDATNYAIFLSVGTTLADVRMDAPEFEACVASWMSAWLEHLPAVGIAPEQLMLLLVDEPHSEEQEVRIIHWAKAVTAAAPEVVIWEDPTHTSPEEAAQPEMFRVSDLLCPNLAIFAIGSEKSRQFYADLQEAGKTLWFYQCSGPAKTHDPYYYHRLQHWYAFKYGAVGSGFWAFGDAALTGNAWNELRAGRSSFTPVYITPDGITDGKHFEAVREGLEDYELLCILRDRADAEEAAGEAGRAAELRELLQQSVDDVCGPGYNPLLIPWSQPKDRTAADQARLRLLEALTP